MRRRKSDALISTIRSAEDYKKPKKGAKKADGTDEGVPVSGDVQQKD